MRKYQEKTEYSIQHAAAAAGVPSSTWSYWLARPEAPKNPAPKREKILAFIQNWEKTRPTTSPKTRSEYEGPNTPHKKVTKIIDAMKKSKYPEKPEIDLQAHCRELVDTIIGAETTRAKASKELRDILGI